jgi:hypothetical protein
MDIRDSKVPSGVDPTVPSVGRMYDYYLNGRYHLPVDVAAAERVREKVPEIHYMAHSNRGFLQRAAGRMARDGVRQFIDVGAGIPTQWNTHEVVHIIDPDAKVVYVDIDPLVLEESREMLRRRGETNAIYVDGDVREPAGIIGHPEVQALIDFSRPVGYIHAAIWHFVAPEDDPYELMRQYMDAVPSGSHLALSHVTADGQRPEKVGRLHDVYSEANAHVYFRDLAEIDKFFTGLEYLSPYEGAKPSLSFCDIWGSREMGETDPAHTWLPAGVARKP